MSPVEKNAFEEKHTLVLDGKEIKEIFLGRLTQEANRMKAPGFRPGKVPMDLVFNKKGKDVFESALREKIQEKLNDFEKTLDRKRVYKIIFSNPHCVVPGLDRHVDDITLDLNVVFNPEIPEIDPATFTIPDIEMGSLDDLVEEVLLDMASKTTLSAALEEDRPSALGDTLLIQMTINDVENPKIVELVLGEDSMLAGVTEDLVHVEKGHTVNHRLKVPKFFPIEGLSGKKINFKLTVQDIRKTVPGFVGEELAQKIGKCDLETFKNTIASDLRKALESRITDFRLENVRCKLCDSLDFEIADVIVQSIEKEVENQFMPSKTSEPLTEEIRLSYIKDYSKRQARLDFFLRFFFEKEKLTISREDLNGAFQELSKSFNKPFNEIVQTFQKNKEFSQFVLRGLSDELALKHFLSKCTTGEPLQGTLPSAWSEATAPCLTFLAENGGLSAPLVMEKIRADLLNHWTQSDVQNKGVPEL